MYKSTGGRPTEWHHKDGERLDVKLYGLPDIKCKKGYSYRAIVASGPTHGPYLIWYAGRTSTGATYKIWYGLSGGDTYGFEETASILKGSKVADTTASVATAPGQVGREANNNKNKTAQKKNAKKPENPTWARQSYTADGTARITTNVLRPKPAPPQTCVPDISSEYRKSSHLSTSHKRKRHSAEPTDYNKLLASFSRTVEPAAHGSQASRQAPQLASHRPDTQVPPEGLDQHIQNNAVFLFYPAQHPAQQQPRVRLFTACNSSQKLFAQALAGDLFAGPSSTKVLSVRIGGQTESRAVVQDDELDFQDLVTAIKGARCWAGDKEGLVVGSCTVEVRAKS